MVNELSVIFIYFRQSVVFETIQAAFTRLILGQYEEKPKKLQIVTKKLAKSDSYHEFRLLLGKDYRL